MQAVGTEQPRRPDARCRDPVGILLERLNPGRDALDAERRGASREHGVQHGPAYSPPHARAEQVIRPPLRGVVTHTAQGHPVRVHAESSQQRQRPGHESLAARLVDNAVARLDEGHGHPGQSCLDRGGEPDGATPHDDDVDVGAHASSRSALFSVGMRKPSSSTALSTVKAIAVTHAVCTSGRAMPSIATIA